MIEFDEVLDLVGHFGRYQIVLCLMVYWLAVTSSINNSAPVFLAADTSFRCRIPALDDNITVEGNFSEAEILNITTPYNYATHEYNTCARYANNLSRCSEELLSCENTSAKIIPCDFGYKFNRTEFSRTIISQWNLVCDRKFLYTISTSVYFLGFMSSGPTSGFISDKFGRKITMLICVIGTSIFGILSVYASSIYMFTATRFFVALFSHGGFVTSSVYVMEITGNKRDFASLCGQLAFVFGALPNTLLAFYFRDWRKYYLGISLIPLPYILFNIFIPESPRWHFSNLRNDEGRRLSALFAKYNKREEISDETWMELDVDEEEKERSTQTYSSFDVFKPPRMRWISVSICIIWFLMTLTFYGIVLSIGQLPGNIFVNSITNVLFPTVAFFVVIFTVPRFGPRINIVIVLICSGFANLVQMILQLLSTETPVLSTLHKTAYYIGYMAIWVAVASAYNHAIEIYPTILRSNGMGVAALSGGLGAIFSPVVLSLSQQVSWLPSGMFCVCSVIPAVLTWFLPETKDLVMPDTIEQAERIYSGEGRNNEQQPLMEIEESQNKENIK